MKNTLFEHGNAPKIFKKKGYWIIILLIPMIFVFINILAYFNGNVQINLKLIALGYVGCIFLTVVFTYVIWCIKTLTKDFFNANIYGKILIITLLIIGLLKAFFEISRMRR